MEFDDTIIQEISEATTEFTSRIRKEAQVQFYVARQEAAGKDLPAIDAVTLFPGPPKKSVAGLKHLKDTDSIKQAATMMAGIGSAEHQEGIVADGAEGVAVAAGGGKQPAGSREEMLQYVSGRHDC